MHRGESDRLVGARKDVPLVVGLGGGRELPRHRRRGDPRPHRPGHLPRGGRRRRPAPVGRRRSPTSTARRGSGRHDHRLDGRGRREGRLRALHAQGDPRAARGAAPGHRRAGSRATDRIRLEELEAFAETILRPSTGSSSIACGTAYYAALVGAAAIQDWTGIPARATVGSEFRYSPPPLDEQDPRHRRDPVRRDGRHDRPDPARPRARRARHRGHQHGRLGDHARGRRGPVPAGRAGDRGRGVQDVRDPGHDAGHPRGGDRQGARRPRRGAGAGARRRAARAAGGGRRGRSRTASAIAEPRPPLRQLARLHVRRPRLHVPGRARGRAQAQGDQLRPRRGLRGRAS